MTSQKHRVRSIEAHGADSAVIECTCGAWWTMEAAPTQLAVSLSHAEHVRRALAQNGCRLEAAADVRYADAK